MEHFIIIRFSVKFNNSPEFNSKQDSLFNEDRLNFRFYLFENFCLPSLVNQTLANFKIIILYDENLPSEYYQKLHNLTLGYNFIILHKWNNNDSLSSNLWLKQYLESNENLNEKYIITTRIDDDDMINFNLNQILFRYYNRFNFKNKIISFKGGFFLNHHSKDNMELVPIKYSSLGIFLTKIHLFNDSNIFNHTHHNHNLPQRIINTERAFIVINHEYENDNRLERFKKKKGIKVSIDDIHKTME